MTHDNITISGLDGLNGLGPDHVTATRRKRSDGLDLRPLTISGDGYRITLWTKQEHGYSRITGISMVEFSTSVEYYLPWATPLVNTLTISRHSLSAGIMAPIRYYSLTRSTILQVALQALVNQLGYPNLNSPKAIKIKRYGTRIAGVMLRCWKKLS